MKYINYLCRKKQSAFTDLYILYKHCSQEIIMANFQRNGSVSNTHVGDEFESKAKSFLAL